MTILVDDMWHTFEEASAVSVETFPSSHSFAGSEIPTIELSSTEDVPIETIDISNVHQHENHQHCSDRCSSAAIAVAELVADTVRDMEEGRRPTTAARPSPKRAEYISATFIKDTVDTQIGLQLSHDNTIDSITPGSMASASPLKEGDRLFSINKRQCQFMKSVEICDILKNLEGRVTIVAHNKGGTASIVESMVAKQHPTERSGLVLKRVGNSSLLVSNIRPDKVFIDSLLNIGDEVLTINGISCTHLSPHEAADIIKQTPRDVTVVARSLLETGVVVAELSAADMLATLASSPARSVRLQQDLDRRRRLGVGSSKLYRDRNFICSVVGFLGCMIAVVIVFVSAFQNNESHDFLPADQPDLHPFAGGYAANGTLYPATINFTAFHPTENITNATAFEPTANISNSVMILEATAGPTAEATAEDAPKESTMVVNFFWDSNDDESDP